MRNYLLNMWYMLDPLYYKLTRLQYVPDSRMNNTIFRVRPTTYKGASVVLQDGTTINKMIYC